MVDITIRGAGIFGLSTAWACLKRGAAVRVVDPNGPGAGSSGGVVGALAPHVPENWNPKKAFQLESLLMAKAFWQDVEASGGRGAGYCRSGRIQPVPDAAALALARRRAETAAELWGDKARWHVERCANGTWHPQSPTNWIIRDTLSALLHPRKAVGALVAALEAHGIIVEPAGLDEGRVLWATGVDGLTRLGETHHRAVGNGVKGQAALLQHDACGAEQLFVDGLHIIPHLDGTVAIGSTSERIFDAGHTTDAQLDEIIEKARAVVPDLKDAPVIERWAGVRPRARSRAPILGAWPGTPGHFIANGGFKIGFGMAPKVAEVMADLLLEDIDNIPEGFEVSASL